MRTQDELDEVLNDIKLSELELGALVAKTLWAIFMIAMIGAVLYFGFKALGAFSLGPNRAAPETPYGDIR